MKESENTLHFDVLIVGAGMVGAAVANGLAISNLKIAVVDTTAPKNVSDQKVPDLRVSAISYASEQILKNVGAWEHIDHSRLCQYKRLGVSEDSTNTPFFEKLKFLKNLGYTEFDADTIHLSHLGHIAENANIQWALHEAMSSSENIRLFCPDEIAKIEKHPEYSCVHLSSGVVIHAGLLIGADGANSKVRTLFNLPSSREKYGQEAFVCNVSYRGQQEDITWQTFYSSGPRAFLPLADLDGIHYGSLVWYDEPAKIKQLKSLDKVSLRKLIITEFPDKLPPIIDIIQQASFPLYKSHAKDYFKDGVVLVGDAAHTINPLAGQGVNLGFLDAAVLIECLTQALANGESIRSNLALANYQKIRRIDNQLMMNVMDAFYYGFSNDLMPLKILRHAGLTIADKAGIAKNKVMQLAIGSSGKLPKLARPA